MTQYENVRKCKTLYVIYILMFDGIMCTKINFYFLLIYRDLD